MSFRGSFSSAAAGPGKGGGGSGGHSSSFGGSSSSFDRSSSKTSSLKSQNSSTSVGGPEDNSYKLVLVGDSGVGKSCILEKLLDSSSTNNFISTIGVDIRSHVVKRDGAAKPVKLQVWDTGGQQRYRPVLSTCYRNAVGIVLVFDVTNRKSFQNLGQWLSEVGEFAATMAGRESTPKLLVGNKSDLTSRRQVDEEIARKFAADKDMSYIETSALKPTSSDIEDALVALALRSSSSTTAKT